MPCTRASNTHVGKCLSNHAEYLSDFPLSIVNLQQFNIICSIQLFIFFWTSCYCSSKVVAAFLESPSSEVKDLAKDELQSLIDTGILKVHDHKAMEK